MHAFLICPPKHLSFLEGKVYQWQNESRARYAMVTWCLARGKLDAAIEWQKSAAKAYQIARALLVWPVVEDEPNSNFME